MAAVVLIAGLAATAIALIAAHQSVATKAGAGSVSRQPQGVAPSSLAPSYGALFGAWVQPTNGDGYTVDGEEAAIVALERAIGRKLAVDQLYVSWAAPMPVAVARWDLGQGIIPMISWAGARTDLIAAGAYDSMIRASALQLKALHRPVLLRWFAEMNLSTDALSPASFVAAWRHIRSIFSSVGANNVRWVWCPSASLFGTTGAQAYYPGSSYVDWVGADGYNWAPERPDSSWRSFGQIFSSFYRWGLSTRKPLLVGEYGVVEGGPGAKAAWFMQADHELRTQFPAIRAVVYFDSDHKAFGRYFNWRVTTSSSALAAFRAFADDRYFRARS
jgi:glycosyl hydrolase family 26